MGFGETGPLGQWRQMTALPFEKAFKTIGITRPQCTMRDPQKGCLPYPNNVSQPASLIVVAAVLGYVNFRYLRLPSSIGMTVMGTLASLLVVALDEMLLSSSVSRDLADFIAGIVFHATLIDGMLSFLLFAGALHASWQQLHKGRRAILVLSTVGVMLSTAIVGTGFLWLSSAMGYPIPAIWCFVFGALISPTNPVSVILPLPAFGKARAAGAIVPVTLIWGGLRGGIFVALALGLPHGSERDLILSATYAVLLFTVIVQGGTIAGILQRLESKNADPA